MGNTPMKMNGGSYWSTYHHHIQHNGWRRLVSYFSVGVEYYLWLKLPLVINLSLENNLPMFRLNALVIIRVKVKTCEQTLLFIAMHY